MRVLTKVEQEHSIDDVRERMASAKGRDVTISYSDGKVDVSLNATIGDVTHSLLVVDYDARDRVTRVHQEGKPEQSVRTRRPCRESFLLADILTGHVDVELRR